MQKSQKSIRDLLLAYYKKHPKEKCQHGPVVDWVERRYLRLYSKKPRDTWRAIRHLHQEGILIKVKKGVYKYDPDYVRKVDLFEFPADIKEAIYNLMLSVGDKYLSMCLPVNSPITF